MDFDVMSKDIRRRMEGAMYEKDQEIIEAILDLIESTPHPGPSQTAVVKHCNVSLGTNRKKVLRVLDIWDGKHWVFTTGDKNAKHYQRWDRQAL